MSLASTLLRVVLMLSLLLNGLNAAMASGHEEMGRMAHAVAAAAAGGDADCHHHAGMQAVDSTVLHNVVAKVLKKGNVSIKDSDLKNILSDYLSSSSSSTTASSSSK